MLKNIPLYIKLSVLCSALLAASISYTDTKSFRKSIDDFIEAHEKKLTDEIPENPLLFTGTDSLLILKKGDWNRNFLLPGYARTAEEERLVILSSGDDKINIVSYGSVNLNLRYGKSFFTDDKYRDSDDDEPVSRVISPGFLPEQDMQLHMEGRIGKRLTVYIDHDSRRKDNHYLMQYRALKDEEAVREINAGEIDISFNHSKYAVYDNSSSKGLGVDVTLKKNRFQVKAFGSVLRGETVVENFSGNSSPANYRLNEYQYIKGKYYQLEPFRRYDNFTSVQDAASVYSSVTVNSTGNGTRYAVNIDPDGFALYMDDQNPDNNLNSLDPLSLDSGIYTKMISGVDFSINFITGLITFLKTIPSNARIFAVYTLRSGSTSDPCVLSPSDPKHPGGIFAGKNFVFIKYGPSIDEDTVSNDLVFNIGESDRNNDGKVNLDIYEVRSFYYLGERKILQDNFNLRFYSENRIMTQAEVSSLGSYSINYTDGTVEFVLREPFKTLTEPSFRNKIYNENQSQSVYRYSRFSMDADYFREARSFSLKHPNVIPGSERIKINGREIRKSFYSIDYTSGFLEFTDPSNPVISSETSIEVKYEYLPFSSTSGSFTGGLRADYAFNKNLNIGGSVLFSRNGLTDTIPEPGSEGEQTVLVEGDASLRLDEKTIGKILSSVTGGKEKKAPLNVSVYGEFARSYREVNTFGKLLLDDMESNDDYLSLAVSEKKWVLSSMPSGKTGTDRGLLYYYYYRNASDPGSLKGESYNAKAVSYQTKPGPYNIATGHVDDSITDKESQTSLVFDYDFTSGNCVSVVTVPSEGSSTDLSGLQYVEISYRFDAQNAGDSIDLDLDMGKINEDSDGDGIEDTEDINGNGFIDTDPDRGYSEDRGYSFNGNNPTVVGSGPGLSSVTGGDGILNREDLNNNGIFEDDSVLGYSYEEVYTVSETIGSTGELWSKKRIYIDSSNLTDSEENLLKRVESIRLSIKQNTGTTGRLYIDSIRLISTRWKQTEGSVSGTDKLKLNLVNSIDDSDYRSDAFLFSQKKVYESLYGEKSSDELDEERESALKIEWGISSGDHVTAERRFARSIDLRHYKTLTMWINPRNFTAGDYIQFTIGSSESDTVSYNVPLEYASIWKEISLRLKDSSGGKVKPYESSGSLDMKRISFFRFKIYSSGSGTIWLNDIYADEAENLKSNAHWVESEINFTRPLFVTDKGTPIFSDISLRFIKKGHDADFSTIGKTVDDMKENTVSLFSSCRVLPNWQTNLDYQYEKTETDSLNEMFSDDNRGITENHTVDFVSDYRSLSGPVPSITLAYSYDEKTNQLDEKVSSWSVARTKKKSSHAPVLSIKENVDNFLFGKLSGLWLVNMFFKRLEIDRSSEELSKDSLDPIAHVKEREKRQKTDSTLSLDYRNGGFYLRPEVSFASEEIVNFSGRTEGNNGEILSDVNGNYHFPFLYSENMRFVNRNRKLKFSTGLVFSDIVRPEYSLELSYFEDSFRDYNENEKQNSGDFSRSKDAHTCLSSGITVPLQFSTVNKMKWFQSLNFSYRRSIELTEDSIPYEGERCGQFEEKYGITRVAGDLDGEAYNLIYYYPGFFLSGGSFFSAGRDYIRDELNRSVFFSGDEEAADYNNTLRLIENFSLNGSFDFDMLNIYFNGSLNGVAERQNVSGIPGQAVTWALASVFNFDLMKILNFWFFRDNRDDLTHHASFMDISYEFSRNMLITSNIEEDSHKPSAGLTFKWGRSSLGLKGGLEMRYRHEKEYISFNEEDRRSEDDIYVGNMTGNSSFAEKDYGYTFSLLYETDLAPVYNFFSMFYKLVSLPVFSFEYSMAINRYDYTQTVSPEPYDLYMLSGKLSLDLHKNVRGGLSSRWALERFRNRESNAISKEILSYEVGFNLSVVF